MIDYGAAEWSKIIFKNFFKNETAGCEYEKCGDIKAIRIFSIYSAFIYFAFENSVSGNRGRSPLNDATTAPEE